MGGGRSEIVENMKQLGWLLLGVVVVKLF